MTMPSSGPISLLQANQELAYAPTSPISWAELSLKTLASGHTDMYDLYGKSNTVLPAHNFGAGSFINGISGGLETGYPLVSHPYSMGTCSGQPYYGVTDNNSTGTENWPNGSTTVSYDVSTPPIYVTSLAARPQNIQINAQFFIESHTAITFYIMHENGSVLTTQAGNGGSSYNFNVVYHSRQYFNLIGSDVLNPGQTSGYYFRCTTYWNGDYDYSIGPSGFLDVTFSFSTWAG